MEQETRDREYDISLRKAKVDLWDNDQYISDEESRPGVALRTRRIQLRHDYLA